MPLLKKLATDPLDYVKIELSRNIVGLIEVCSQLIVSDEIMPIVLSFIKNNELAVGIIKNFDTMTKKVSI
jgi:hypothetical protein